MRATGTIFSSVGHAALLGWGLVSFAPEPLEDRFVETIPIEFVTSAEITDLTKGVKTAKEVIDSEETVEEPETVSDIISQNPGPAEKPVEEAKPEPVETAANEPIEATPPEAEPPAPKPPEPKPLVEVKKAETPKEQPKPLEVAKAPDAAALEELIEKETAEPAKLEEAKPVAKAPAPLVAPPPRINPRPKRQVATAKPNELLNKQEPKSSASGKPQKKASVGTSTGRKGAPLTQSELDGLRDAIQRCWTLPAGYTAGQDFRAIVRAQLNQDGRVAGKVNVVSVTGFSGGSSFLVKNAVKVAIQQCAPYKLPVAKYAQWKNLEVTFYP